VGLDGIGVGPRLVEPELTRVVVGRVDGEDDVAALAGVDEREVGQQQVADSPGRRKLAPAAFPVDTASPTFAPPSPPLREWRSP
jgi:hypothetical protein